MFSHHRARTAGDLGPQISALLRDGANDGRASHLALRVDDDSRVVFQASEIVLLLTLKVQLIAFASAVALALPDDDSRQDLLTQLRLALLDRSQEKLANRALGKSVQAGADLGDGNDVQVLGASVVSTVHNAKRRNTGGDSQLGAGSASSCSLAHCVFSLVLRFILTGFLSQVLKRILRPILMIKKSSNTLKRETSDAPFY